MARKAGTGGQRGQRGQPLPALLPRVTQRLPEPVTTEMCLSGTRNRSWFGLCTQTRFGSGSRNVTPGVTFQDKNIS